MLLENSGSQSLLSVCSRRLFKRQQLNYIPKRWFETSFSSYRSVRSSTDKYLNRLSVWIIFFKSLQIHEYTYLQGEALPCTLDVNDVNLLIFLYNWNWRCYAISQHLNNLPLGHKAMTFAKQDYNIQSINSHRWWYFWTNLVALTGSYFLW